MFRPGSDTGWVMGIVGSLAMVECMALGGGDDDDDDDESWRPLGLAAIASAALMASG